MGNQRPSLDDEWQGLEPVQPKQRSEFLWIGVALGVIALSCLCLVGAYFLIGQFSRQPGPGLPPPPSVPTPLIVLTETAVSSPTDSPAASPTNLPQMTATSPLVPTITLPAAPPTVPPPTSNVEATPALSPPTIDGDLSEWVGIRAYESTYRVFSAPSWDGTDDLTAVWRLAWDATNLYIAVTVTDDVHVQTQTGNQIFRGDSVDMQFETNLARASSQLGPSNFQITFSPGNFAGLPPSAFRFQGTSQGQMLDAPGGHRVTVAAQKTAVGYNLEAAIPWSDLNVTPFTGLVMGVALNANDNDTPGTAVQEVMKSHVSTRTFANPTTWGTLTLR